MHDTIGYVSVQRIIGRKDLDAVLCDQVTYLEERRPHFNIEFFYLVASCHHAAIIVGEDDHRLVAKGNREQALARHVEIVTIDQGHEMLHDPCLLKRSCKEGCKG